MCLYGFLVRVIGLLIAIASYVFPSLRPQANGRRYSQGQWDHMEVWAASYGKRILFFVSSAGEYEQALPLVDRLEARSPDLGICFVFFSQSGIRFARTQNEPRLCLKAPWDDVFIWRRVFSVIRPSQVFVVRYELWPGFLSVAAGYGTVVLINAVIHRRLGWFEKKLKASLLRYIDAIFTVNESDKSMFQDLAPHLEDRMWAIGDTKYERVLQRTIERKELWLSLKSELDKKWGERHRMILGSAWHKEVELFLNSVDDIKTKYGLLPVIIAPHDVSAEMIAWIEQRCDAKSLSWARFSRMETLQKNTDILIVDKIGILPELYGCADYAMVGGALHHRVHNVLEPAVRGLSICFGPLYHTSMEAVKLANEGLATIVESKESFLEWILQVGQKENSINSKMNHFINENCGVSEKILATDIEKEA
ncbi:MAG: hypothetical protein HRU19_11770 [Pseudobacteriovorax sp.]|nr:hypothetical protein [Pseudobacteriovorax sp.]